MLASERLRGQEWLKIWVGVTDNNWFDFLSRIPAIDEVNFWQPSGQGNFRAVEPGSLFVFKLKAPRNVIGGFGIFSHATSCPVSLAWEAFGQKNGAATYDEMWSAIAASRSEQPSWHEDFTIGCRIVTQPVFLDKIEWTEVPENWSSNIVVGKGYDVDEPEGRRLWEAIATIYGGIARSRIPGRVCSNRDDWRRAFWTTRTCKAAARPGRISSTRNRCLRAQMRGHRGESFSALDVAHIRPYSDGGEHRVSNGLLLRRDIHTLLDRGYVTIDPALRFVVSKRVKTEFNNGEEYRRLHGKTIFTPDSPSLKPDAKLLDWHNRTRFPGLTRNMGPALDHHRHLARGAGARPHAAHERALSLLPPRRQPGGPRARSRRSPARSSPTPPTHGDIRQGFVYERAPHITLKSIANNAEIDVIWETYQQTLEPLRAELNKALGKGVRPCGV